MSRWSAAAVTAVVVALVPAQEVALADTQPAPEMATDGPVLAPIRYQKWFEGERELFGYSPRFVPNAVTFDRDNRPYIRTDLDHESRPDVVQTLGDDGSWVSLEIGPSITQAYPAWDGEMLRGPGSERRVVFDDDGDAYTLADCRSSNLERVLLLHSRDRCRTWTTYELDCYFARLEFQSGHNDLSRPPAIAARGGRTHLFLFTPGKRPDGTLEIGEPVQMAVSCVGGGLPAHSGASNVVATLGDRTHLVFARRYAVDGHVGTPQYARGLNRATGEAADEVLLGAAGIDIDGHNWPAVTLDSEGYLHAVLGAHGSKQGQHFKYARSLRPNDSTEFTPATRVHSGLTYPALVCDAQDTLHLVARSHGLPYRLVYARKRPGEEWGELRDLIVPYVEGTAFYAIWYHKLAIDREGRLFLSWWHYARPMTPEQARAYLAKFPDDEIAIGDDGALAWPRLSPHNPGMMVSDDAGETWRLATTADFVAGMATD